MNREKSGSAPPPTATGGATGPARRKALDSRLIAGLSILAFLVLVSVVGPHYAPYGKDAIDFFRRELVDGQEKFFYAPESPKLLHLLGTDPYGYDMLSVLLRGLKWTLSSVGLIALTRTLLGLGFGLASAALRKPPVGRQKTSPLSVFPAFIIAWFLIWPVGINSRLSQIGLFVWQCAVIVLLELPPLARSFAAKAGLYAQSSFVEAARSAGASQAWIARRHIFPFLLDDAVAALPTQAIAAATFIARLGFFSLFIGGTTLTFDPPLLRSTIGEAIGLMGHFAFSVMGRPWLFLDPFAVWLLIFLAVELCASGLRRSLHDGPHPAELGRVGTE